VRKLRLGLLGTGIAPRKLYLPAFAEVSSRVDLVACANRTKKKALDYAKLAGIPKVVNDAEALFALPEVEAVLISLPIDVQPRYVLAALAAGKAVLSEKPVGPSVAAARALVKKAKRFRAPWLVGENFAFMPHVERLVSWVKDEKLGSVRLLEATQMTVMDERNPYFHTPWRAKPGHVGGFVADAGVHLACAVRRAFGVPTGVKGFTAQFERALPPLDTAVAALRFSGGTLGTWRSCFSAPYEGPMLRLYGSKANAELFYDHARLVPRRGKATTFRPGVNSFAAELAHFADVVQRGVAPGYTPEEAVADLELMTRIVSAR
jgi:predicted dehydrogenase